MGRLRVIAALLGCLAVLAAGVANVAAAQDSGWSPTERSASSAPCSHCDDCDKTPCPMPMTDCLQVHVGGGAVVLAAYQNRVLPLRATVSRQVELRYGTAVNVDPAMRVDLFKVLADARARISANAAAVDARRDFELAEVDLQAALTFGTGDSRSIGGAMASTMEP
jgi:hypothetical protein